MKKKSLIDKLREKVPISWWSRKCRRYRRCPDPLEDHTAHLTWIGRWAVGAPILGFRDES